VAAREQELLPVGYVHVVFTMPESLARLALVNKRVVYDLLFQATAETLLQVARNPKHLGGAVGGLMVLHTWGQRLQHHPHVHCVVPMGGLAPDGGRWIHARPRFFFPIAILRKLVRGKLLAGLRKAFQAGRLNLPGSLSRLKPEAAFSAFLRTLYRQPWIVYAKPPFGSAAHVLQYLARYTHRVAISNHRIVNVTDDAVSFRWKDYRHGSAIRTLTLPAEEFLRRFLLHVLPKRFVRIRYFGFLASRCRTPQLAQCRQALVIAPAPPVETGAPTALPRSWPCPRCGGTMRLVERASQHGNSSFRRCLRTSSMTRRSHIIASSGVPYRAPTYMRRRSALFLLSRPTAPAITHPSLTLAILVASTRICVRPPASTRSRSKRHS
jgi:hypothetical protein